MLTPSRAVGKAAKYPSTLVFQAPSHLHAALVRLYLLRHGPLDIQGSLDLRHLLKGSTARWRPARPVRLGLLLVVYREQVQRASWCPY